MNTTTLELRGRLLNGKGQKRRGEKIVGRATVLDDDFTRNVLRKMAWHLNRQGYPATWMRTAAGKRKLMTLHRLVYENYYYGPHPPGRDVDHIDRNPLHNVPKNLRMVSRSVNIANSQKRLHNTSGFKGVTWDKSRKLWPAKITKNRKIINLGRFTEIRAAARAVNAAYREHFPEVAIPNPEVELVEA